MDEVSAVGYLIHGFNGLSDLIDEPLAPMACRRGFILSSGFFKFKYLDFNG